VECLFRGLRLNPACYSKAAHSREVDLTLGVETERLSQGQAFNTTRLRSSSLAVASIRHDLGCYQPDLHGIPGSGVWCDLDGSQTTPESWSLLQSDCVARDQHTASRASILPLMRFIQIPPSPYKISRVHSRHASTSSAIDCQINGHVPPSWFFTNPTAFSA